MEEDILNFPPTVIFRGTEQTVLLATDIQSRDVIRRLCNKDRDQGQKGIGVRYRSCSDIQYIG